METWERSQESINETERMTMYAKILSSVMFLFQHRNDRCSSRHNNYGFPVEMEVKCQFPNRWPFGSASSIDLGLIKLGIPSLLNHHNQQVNAERLETYNLMD